MEQGHRDDAHSEGSATEALQFLIAAAGILVLIRLVHAAGSWALSPADDDAIGRLTEPFRRGYLLCDAHELVPGGMSLAGRSAIAVLLGMAGGALGAIAGRWGALALGRAGRIAWRNGLRIGLAITASWALASALLWPPLAIRLESDRFILIERPSLLGTIALAWPARARNIPWSDCGIAWVARADARRSLQIDLPDGALLIEPADDDGALLALEAFLRDRLQRISDEISASGNAIAADASCP